MQYIGAMVILTAGLLVGAQLFFSLGPQMFIGLLVVLALCKLFF